ncbi:50S ribosomal protein L17 [Candidatus Gottesmanbacteria bacterium]|nr:50S ribosomal protein L17 [Candidatus Gottesmanbacteria bacterium]
MRHQVFGKKLNRDVKERKALFRSLIWALISYGKIKTSIAKAKAIQRLADKLVTKAKDGSDNAIRQVSAFLTKKDVINKLTKEIAPRFAKISGGYLRLRRIGKRSGDDAEEVVLEWSVPEEKKTEVKPVKAEASKSELKKIEKKVQKKTKTSTKGRK